MRSYFENSMKDFSAAVFGSAGNSLRTLSSVLLGITSSAVNLGSPYVLLKGFEILANENPDDDSLVYFYVGGYGALWFTGRALQSLRIMLLSNASAELSQNLVEQVIKEYYHRPFEKRASSSNAIEVQHYSNSYVHIGRNFITAPLSNLLPSVIETGAVSVFLSTQYDYSGFFLGGIGLLFLSSVWLGSRQTSVSKTQWNKEAFSAFESLAQRLNQYENALYNGNVEYELNELSLSLKKLNNAYKRDECSREIVNILQKFVIGAGLVNSLLWYGNEVINGNMEPQDIILLVLYLGQFATSLDEISKVFAQLKESYVSYKAIQDYLYEAHVLRNDMEHPNLGLHTRHETVISFHNVCLKYPTKDLPVLNNVSFKIKRGERVAIVGTSGSGKTTLFQSMLGFQLPTSGKIFINKQNIASVNKPSIRDAFAVVPQTPYLLNDTFYNNVKYGYHEAEETDIARAIEESHLSSTIHFFGHQNKIGEDGKKISGGQRQRISLARAILRLYYGAQFIIADEPTSALDAKTAKIIIRQIFKLLKTLDTVTFLLITHNLRDLNASMIDRVFVMDQGELVEEGSISALLEKKGFFHKMTKKAGIRDEELLKSEESESDDLSDEIQLDEEDYLNYDHAINMESLDFSKEYDETTRLLASSN